MPLLRYNCCDKTAQIHLYRQFTFFPGVKRSGDFEADDGSLEVKSVENQKFFRSGFEKEWNPERVEGWLLQSRRRGLSL